jgi:hypothetical protein
LILAPGGERAVRTQRKPMPASSRHGNHRLAGQHAALIHGFKITEGFTDILYVKKCHINSIE